MKILDHLQYDITASSKTTIKFTGQIATPEMIGRLGRMDILRAISFGSVQGGSCHLNIDGSFYGQYIFPHNE